MFVCLEMNICLYYRLIDCFLALICLTWSELSQIQDIKDLNFVEP